MDQDKMSSPADPEKVELAITVTPNELKQAVARYDLMLPGEVTAIYTVMLAVPEFGLRVAMALQDAARAVSSGAMPRERVLDAAVVPAFMVGLMVGRGQTTSQIGRAYV